MRRTAALCVAVTVALVSYGTHGVHADRSEEVGRIEAATAGLAVKGAEQILRKEVNAGVHADLLSRLKSEL